ncbi:hypothetical protein ABZ322_35105 [Streptomyces sp. NPDC006129]|uniref:hypothetical protein n=1 Tax=Streptomyces sp. NPDC006129 TaxID=3155348 RepID=UPI0033B143AB
MAAGLTALRGGLRIVPYYWGGTHGATLAAGGASLPAEPGGTSRALTGPDGEEETAAAWAALYADPYAELALAAAGTPQRRRSGVAGRRRARRSPRASCGVGGFRGT